MLHALVGVVFVLTEALIQMTTSVEVLRFDTPTFVIWMGKTRIFICIADLEKATPEPEPNLFGGVEPSCPCNSHH